MNDLLVVVPDKTWKAVIDELLRRPEALSIRKINWTVAVHTGRDCGVRAKGPELAAGLSRLYSRAILLLDHEGCGDLRSPEKIEEDLRGKLRSHWADRADAIVISPELEIWLWRALSQMARLLEVSAEKLREKLSKLGYLKVQGKKPERPKEAFLALLKEEKKIPSAALYAEIARQASLRLEGCQSQSYPRFVTLLRSWFPSPSGKAS